MFSTQKHVEPLSNGVTILTCFVQVTDEEIPLYANLSLDERVERMNRAIRMRHVFPYSRYNELCLHRKLQVFEAAYCHAAAKFVFQFTRSVGPAFTKISKAFESLHETNGQELYAGKRLTTSLWEIRDPAFTYFGYPWLLRSISFDLCMIRLYSIIHRLHINH